jgi:hypothetical protein
MTKDSTVDGYFPSELAESSDSGGGGTSTPAGRAGLMAIEGEARSGTQLNDRLLQAVIDSRDLGGTRYGRYIITGDPLGGAGQADAFTTSGQTGSTVTFTGTLSGSGGYFAGIDMSASFSVTTGTQSYGFIERDPSFTMAGISPTARPYRVTLPDLSTGSFVVSLEQFGPLPAYAVQEPDTKGEAARIEAGGLGASQIEFGYGADAVSRRTFQTVQLNAATDWTVNFSTAFGYQFPPGSGAPLSFTSFQVAAFSQTFNPSVIQTLTSFDG